MDCDELLSLAERVRDAVIEMGEAGKAITHVSSTVVPEDDYFQSVLKASSGRLVREAHAHAGDLIRAYLGRDADRRCQPGMSRAR